MKVSVVGLGYVGSIAAAGLASAGHDVLGVDTDRAKIIGYREGSLRISERGLSALIRRSMKDGRLRFAHADEVAEPLGEAIIVATGTPMLGNGAPDLSQVRSALSWIRDRSDAGVVMMKSTVPVGAGLRLMEAELGETGLRYVSNPEFLREGQAVEDWFHPDRIVIGAQDDATVDVVRELYQGMDAPYVVTDVTSAEMIKYASNAFLATKISFINEIAMLCERSGATIDDVSRGISLDPRIGPNFLQAGVGYGGSCFPKDVRALDYLALTNGHNFELLKSVITVNNRQRLQPLIAVRERLGGLSGARVGVLGLAFKPNTDDVREAPSLDLIRTLVEQGSRVCAYDPEAMPNARSALPSSVRFASGPEECADRAQALVLVTEWPSLVQADWPEMARRMEPPRLLFDGRNALDPREMREHGFEYRGVGRPAPGPR